MKTSDLEARLRLIGLPEHDIKKIIDGVVLQHARVTRKYCVALAEIGLAIISGEGAELAKSLKTIGRELGIDNDALETGLKEFIENGPQEKEIEAQATTKVRRRLEELKVEPFFNVEDELAKLSWSTEALDARRYQDGASRSSDERQRETRDAFDSNRAEP
jgi:hypothetical protein